VLLASAWLLLHGFGGVLHLGHLRASEQLDIVKISLSVVAGVGGVIALTVAYRKQQLGEAAHGREEVKLFTERFGACVAQLGDDSPAVRLGGAYALAHLADDWQTGRQTCIDVLCAQLRMPYPADQSDDPEAHAAFLSQREIRHTIWRLIGDHLRPGSTQHSWNEYNFNFTGAQIDGADLHAISLTSGTVDFSDAKFLGGTSNFSHAEIRGGMVDFSGAEFSDGSVDFTNAKFSGGTVNFWVSRFTGGTVDFHHADFCGGRIDLFDAELSAGMMDFFTAKFSGSTFLFSNVKFLGGDVDFSGAELTDGTIRFSGAMFCDGRVGFSAATFTGCRVDFTGANFHGGCVDVSKPANVTVSPIFDSWSIQPKGFRLPR
jgi:uncharacterized protein YjbI with pentapeptide repeats